MKLKTLILAAALLGAAPVANADSLYDDLGGLDNITRFTNRLVDRTFADPRTAHQFKQTKKDRLARLLVDQICEATGGPCRYKGVNMKKSHIKLLIKFDRQEAAEIRQEILDDILLTE